MIFFKRLFALPYNFFIKFNKLFHTFFDKKQSKFQSILVTLSGSSNDEKSIELAKNLIEKKSGTLTFVHVLEIDLKTPLDAEIQEKTNHGDKILSSIFKKHNIEGYNYKAILLQARNAGPAIISEASNQSAEAIIISKNKNLEQNIVDLSKTTKYVLTNSECDVLFIQT